MGYDAYDRRQMGGVIRLVALVSLAAALLAVPAGASATPSVTTVSAAVPSGAVFAGSANGSVIAYQVPAKSIPPAYVKGKGLFYAHVYVWQSGRIQRVDNSKLPAYGGSSGTTNGQGVAVSADGNVVAYAAERNNKVGTVFYDVANHTRTFIASYIFGSSLDDSGAQLLSANGQYALLSRGEVERDPATYGIYDRANGSFTPLPHRGNIESHGLSLSANGQVVIYAELKPYSGEVGTVIYDMATHKGASLKYRSEDIHWLSENGNIALIEGGSTNDAGLSAYQYDYTIYNLATGTASGPTSPFGGPDGNPLGFPETPSLTGDGETVAFLCKKAIYTYNEAQGHYSLVLNQAQEFGEMVITANGNDVLYSNAKGNGLYEATTQYATTASAPEDNC